MSPPCFKNWLDVQSSGGSRASDESSGQIDY
jgi:hypothetical protein